MRQKIVTTDILDIAYREYGAPDGWLSMHRLLADATPVVDRAAIAATREADRGMA